jgi:hypothetical protein
LLFLLAGGCVVQLIFFFFGDWTKGTPARWVPATPWTLVVLARLTPAAASLLLDLAVWRAAVMTHREPLPAVVTLASAWPMLVRRQPPLVYERRQRKAHPCAPSIGLPACKRPD